MSTWKNTQNTEICKDARTMRKNFIIDVLASDLNDYQKLLPANVKDYLSRITNKNIK